MPELSSNNTGSGALETLDLINAPDETPIVKEPVTPEIKEPEVEVEAEPDDESAEDKEPELNLSESDEDEFTYTATPTASELKKTFPDLFKKYPSLEKTIRRESHYAEVFPTIQEARDAAEQINSYRQVESELNSGSISGILNSLKKSNSKAFGQVTGGILETLKEIDQEAFYEVTTQNVSRVLGNAFNKFKGADKESGDYQVALAAQILYKYITNGDTKVGEQPIARREEVNPKEAELTKKEQEFEVRRFNSATTEVNSKVKSIAQASVEKAIDPRDVMTPFAKNAAIKQCMDELVEEIQTDGRFNKLLVSAWTQSRSEDYSDASKAKIRKMLLSKAQNVLPAIIQRIRNEAVKGSRKSREESNDEKPLGRGRPTGSTSKTSGSNGKDKTVPANMSTRDFLMAD